VVGTIATGLLGVALKKPVEPLFASPLAVGVTLLITGTVLWLTSYRRDQVKDGEKMGFWDAVWVGIVQGLALIPGISRSGMTVSVGLFRGLERELAARFSFLLMIPATVGALAISLSSPGGQGSVPNVCILVGTLAAFGTGYVALRLLLGMIRRGSFHRFAYYCWGVGGLAVILSLVG
jgi:undecaprenyl-diphosphatase